MKLRTRALTLAAAAVAALLAGGALTADEGADGRTKLMLRLDRDGGPDSLEVEDLGALAVGESRQLTTQEGRPVTVTREEDGWVLDIDGKQVRVGAGGGETRLWKERRVVVDGEPGKGRSMVIVSGDGEEGGNEEIRIVRRLGLGEEHGFAFGAPPPGAPAELLIARLERNEKFLTLDEATRQTVLEAIRESAPRMHRVFVGEEGEPGAPGERTIVLELVERHEETE